MRTLFNKVVIFSMAMSFFAGSALACYPGLGDCSTPSGQDKGLPAQVEKYDPVNTAKAFYLALSKADGDSAAAFVVPEKRGMGPFNEASIRQFYSSLREPLKIRSVERISNDFVELKYRYIRPNGGVCDGTAKVNTIYTNGRTFIQGISANC